MSTEQLVEQILSKRPEISRKELLEKLEDEKKKTGGFISDESLLRMIAVEFGVEVQNNKVLVSGLLIKDLIPGLSDIVVVGRVIAVFSPMSFEGKKSGKLASIFVADKSGVLRVVFWNSKTSIVESGDVKTGQVIRLSHGYTREDRGGKVELHIGEKGEVEIQPRNAGAEEYPYVSTFATKIEEITHAYRNKRVNIIGMVREAFSSSTFQRQDSSLGKVLRFVLSDETGEISVVVWNEKVDELEGTLHKGVQLALVNAKVKKALGEGFEVHVDTQTYAELFKPKEVFSKIADLRTELNSVNVKGKVVTKPVLRSVKTSKGEVVELVSFGLEDETGRIWVSAWRKHAETVENLKISDKIVMRNVYVKKGFCDQFELSTKNATSITSI